jgi:hypothetical protein
LVAATEQVYEVPLVRPVTESGLDAPVAVSVLAPAALQLATYVSTGEPPSDVGALNVTRMLAFPGVATTAVGASGTETVGGVMAVPLTSPPPQAASARTSNGGISETRCARESVMRAADECTDSSRGASWVTVNGRSARASVKCARQGVTQLLAEPSSTRRATG